ncbi:hypothetical protein A3A03_00360 [Candidatus Nomurabacteria bacterium RIFCSPLOWO2_01_FULL_40_18]|uniref:DUF2914 domain-containing protein n=1 Tax=Candidatus Nomurabacteria bacterium RIFCSPLOWO2_01_FULL_40_18 TaxID=1801773 RepID=A0A1F6XLG0_9BACT|nr:MAG: hypothetical protein A3A03_00360 [Candidatus Nomurabacteria bacterium RIFCSPLOWO2_01_FULL_40_18]
MRFIEPVRDFYHRFEHRISSLFLIGGFVFDAFTLKRADALWENLWIMSYLFLIAIFIMLIHITEKRGGRENNSKAHFWYVNILQFAFGGIFSAYLVLYFRSADILVAWPFIALLAIIFIANEFLKKHYVRLSFQISLFFLAIYSFFIFLVPVVIHKIGASIFLFSGLISIIFIALFLKVLFYFIKDKFSESKNLIIWLISGIFILVNILYFTNLIPPIPLSLKEAGVYNSVQRNTEGYLVLTYEDTGWTKYFRLYPNFKKVEGKPVYAFSSIFSPKNLNITILHEWQYYNQDKNKWTTESVIRLPIVGGRDGGFRTYSVKTDLAPGKWRVNVKTEQDQTIGHLRFTIVPVDVEPPMLKTTLK